MRQVPRWSLSHSCKGKFEVGQKVRTRGDMGNIKMEIVKIHNEHFCECRTHKFGRLQHWNMNCLNPIFERSRS